MTGLSRPTVSKYMNQLRENGILKIVEDWSYTKQRARVYYMEYLAANSDVSQFIPVDAKDTVASMFKRTMLLVDRVSYHLDTVYRTVLSF
jgi:hypothetical protein